MIYPYLWGGEPEAYLTITSGGSKFVSQPPLEIINEADLMLQVLYAELSANFDDESL